jgi:hypothetical protein
MLDIMNIKKLITEQTMYGAEQFNDSQLNEIAHIYSVSGISKETVASIIQPNISDITYSILADYFSKVGDSFDVNEFNAYKKIDLERIDEIICNVYIGKLHGLSKDLIGVYTQKDIKNIKVARLLVEKLNSTLSKKELSQIIHCKMSNTTYGKLLLQDFIDGNISKMKFFAVIDVPTINQQEYEFINSATLKDLLLFNVIAKRYGHKDFNYQMEYIKKLKSIIVKVDGEITVLHNLDDFIDNNITFSDNKCFDRFIHMIRDYNGDSRYFIGLFSDTLITDKVLDIVEDFGGMGIDAFGRQGNHVSVYLEETEDTKEEGTELSDDLKDFLQKYTTMDFSSSKKYDFSEQLLEAIQILYENKSTVEIIYAVEVEKISLDEEDIKLMLTNYRTAVSSGFQPLTSIWISFCSPVHHINTLLSLATYAKDDEKLWKAIMTCPYFISSSDNKAALIGVSSVKLQMKINDWSTVEKIVEKSSDKQIKDIAEKSDLTSDVIIRFCEEVKVPKTVIVSVASTLGESLDRYEDTYDDDDYDDYDDDYVEDDYIEESFDDSRVFETRTLGDTIAIYAKEIADDPIIQFKKDETTKKSEYDYFFEIKNKYDELQYSCKVKTRADVVKAINKTIALISGVPKYQKYITELEDRRAKFE